MLRGRIIGSGSYLPEKVVTNHDLEKMMETSDEWIRQRTGIEERHWVEPGEQCTSDLALEASLKAIEDAGIEKEEIDLIVFATLSPDHEFPGTGCFLQAKLGLPGVPALDLRAQCSGFMYSLSIADQYLRSGMYKTALVVGAEVQSIGLDKTTKGRDVSVLFGDGAGAVILQAVEYENKLDDPGVISTHMWSDGRFADQLWISCPGSNSGKSERIDEEILKEGKHYAYMNGKKVYVHAIKSMMGSLKECFEANQVTPDQIDLYLFHQANLRINEAIAEKMAIPAEKVFNTIQKTGNTTAATIPICIDQARKAGKIKEGSLVACSAFGSGFTWSSALIRF